MADTVDPIPQNSGETIVPGSIRPLPERAVFAGDQPYLDRQRQVPELLLLVRLQDLRFRMDFQHRPYRLRRAVHPIKVKYLKALDRFMLRAMVFRALVFLHLRMAVEELSFLAVSRQGEMSPMAFHQFLDLRPA